MGLLGAALLPPEHIHVARGDGDHVRQVVHRHFESHHSAASPIAIEHDDDDHDVQWLTLAFTATHWAAALAQPFVVTAFALVTIQPTIERTIPLLMISAHDPPWASPSGLRAPPNPAL
jgi:hypothetical protein